MDNDLTIKNKLPVPGLYGLVACGGKSSRMGTDKSMLVYHKKPQRYYLYEMLETFCEQVFISCNAEQENEMITGHDTIVDLAAYKNTGPMAALLTAFTLYPEKNFLMIGCDYPFLTENDLYLFLQKCNEEMSMAFYNDKEEMYEPLLACYHHTARSRLQEMHSKGLYSLQEFLRNDHAIKFYPENKNSIIGINAKKDFIEVKELINLLEA